MADIKQVTQREPEVVYKVIKGIQVRITYSHKKSIEQVKNEILKVLFSEKMS